MKERASQLEMDAILISRLLRSEDHVLVGAGLVAARSGALLAALTHARGLRVCQALGWIDIDAMQRVRPPRPGMDLRDAAGAEALLLDDAAYDDVNRLSDVFIIGGFEIDRVGATNLLGTYSDGHWLRRGPGAIGTTSMAVVADRTVVYSARHDPRVFVERCSLRSSPGWSAPDDVSGPALCISPAGVFDFPEPGHQMRLVHVRPGWTAESIQDATGFALLGLDNATPLPDPDAVELGVLREQIDPEGTLR